MYNPTLWKDHVEGLQEGTDLNAANLNNMEKGAMDAQALAAFLAYHRSVGGNVPFVESKQDGGGYYRDVPVVLPNGGVITEKEWLVKPTPIVPAGEYRTTGRFYSYPIYEHDLFNLDGLYTEDRWSLNSEKIAGGMVPAIIEVTGMYCTEKDFDRVAYQEWKPINDGVVDVKISRSEGVGASERVVKLTTTLSELPPCSVTVRYIYIERREEE